MPTFRCQPLQSQPNLHEIRTIRHIRYSKKKKLARDCTTEATVALRGRNPPIVVGSKSKSHIVIKFGQPFSTAHHWFGPKTWVLKYFTMLLFPKLYVLIVRQRNLYYLMRRFYLILILLQDTMFKQTSWFPLLNYVSAGCYHPSIIHQNLSSMLRPSYIKTLSPLLSQVGNKTLLAACLYPTMPIANKQISSQNCTVKKTCCPENLAFLQNQIQEMMWIIMIAEPLFPIWMCIKIGKAHQFIYLIRKELLHMKIMQNSR